MAEHSDPEQTEHSAPGQEIMVALLEKADTQGFLTTDDIIDAMPDADEALEQLEEIFMWLHASGVEVFGDKSDAFDLDAADEMLDDEDDDDAYDLSGVSSDDTVGLYLKEMARVRC